MNSVLQYISWSMNISQDKVKNFSRGRQGYCLYCFSNLIILGGNEVNSVLEGYPLSIIILIICIVLSLVFFDNYGGALF